MVVGSWPALNSLYLDICASLYLLPPRSVNEPSHAFIRDKKRKLVVSIGTDQKAASTDSINLLHSQLEFFVGVTGLI